ncbi:MAG: SpoIIE family protein phosphatase [Candidatus Riflebacteria bacterium]|nr:SpoIIE family protein phosphatase [Candidatus Riflebacteria bacterium]
MNKVTTVLVVDDEVNNRDIVCRRLEKRGFKTISVDSGKKAMDILSDQVLDLILLDVTMPEMDGFEVLREVRKKFTPLQLPVLMFTARDQSEDIVAALKEGANDYLTKPLDFTVAYARMTTQIALKRASEDLEKRNQIFQFEVALAKQLLRSLFPKQVPSMQGFEFGFKFVPSFAIGGDFFDVLPDATVTEMGFIFGDISGHGVSAALLSTMFKSQIRSCFAGPDSYIRKFEALNDCVGKEFPADSFVCCCLLMLDSLRSSVSMISATPLPLLILQPDRKIRRIFNGGPPLGFFPTNTMSEPYNFQSMQLVEGETLVVFTDGLTELEDGSGSIHSHEIERLENWILEESAGDAQNLADRLLEKAMKFSGKNTFDDDIMIMVIKKT